MRILALDTGTESCSVALLVGTELIEESLELGRGHAQEILHMVDRVLSRGGASLSSLSGIAAGVGPGSFTGVRIGVAVAQGLAFGAGLPVLPVTTLEALALPLIARGAQRVLACLDARMGEVYYGCFAGRPAPPTVYALGPLRVAAPADLVLPPRPQAAADFVGVGRGFCAYPELLRRAHLCVAPEDARKLPAAGDMARLGAARLAAGEGLDAGRLEPVYVRDKVALTEDERRAPGPGGK